jgi:hypothetical protein
MTEEKENAGVSEFLNPKSMLTPGICGAVIMVAANALGAAFALEGPTRSFVCLGLSFLAGTLVFASGVKKLWPKIAYYVFNSLIIFSAAAGVNFSGQKALGDAATATEGTNTVVMVTNTVVVVQYVTNGIPIKPVPKPVFKPTTNHYSAVMPATKMPPRFIQSWK